MLLRKSVADAPRRARVSAAANERYLAALAAVPADATAGDVTQPVCRPIVKKARRYRAFNPWGPKDAALFDAIGRGEWMLNGFRHRDLRTVLHGATPTQPNASGMPAVSPGPSPSCAPTASSRKSPAPTAIELPSADVTSLPLYYPRAKLPSLNY